MAALASTRLSSSSLPTTSLPALPLRFSPNVCWFDEFGSFHIADCRFCLNLNKFWQTFAKTAVNVSQRTTDVTTTIGYIPYCLGSGRTTPHRPHGFTIFPCVCQSLYQDLRCTQVVARFLWTIDETMIAHMLQLLLTNYFAWCRKLPSQRFVRDQLWQICRTQLNRLFSLVMSAGHATAGGADQRKKRS